MTTQPNVSPEPAARRRRTPLIVGGLIALALAVAFVGSAVTGAFIGSTIDVNGNVVCSFIVTPATVSPTEVALTSTSILATVRPGISTASQNFVLDLSTGRWSAKAGTYRGR